VADFGYEAIDPGSQSRSKKGLGRVLRIGIRLTIIGFRVNMKVSSHLPQVGGILIINDGMLGIKDLLGRGRVSQRKE
jgi:hypothetical protein